jgi:hypothetical protein
MRVMNASNPDERRAWTIFWAGIAAFALGILTAATGFFLHVSSTFRAMKRIETLSAATPTDIRLDLGPGWSITIVGVTITVLGGLVLFVACVLLWNASRRSLRSSSAWA